MHVKLDGTPSAVNTQPSVFMDVTNSSVQSNSTFGPEFPSALHHHDEGDDLWYHHSHSNELEKALLAASSDLLPGEASFHPTPEDPFLSATSPYGRAPAFSLSSVPSSAFDRSGKPKNGTLPPREGVVVDRAASYTPPPSSLRTPSAHALRASSQPSPTPKRSGALPSPTTTMVDAHPHRRTRKGSPSSSAHHGADSSAFGVPAASHLTRPPSPPPSSSLSFLATRPTHTTRLAGERYAKDASSASPFISFSTAAVYRPSTSSTLPPPTFTPHTSHFSRTTVTSLSTNTTTTSTSTSSSSSLVQDTRTTLPCTVPPAPTTTTPSPLLRCFGDHNAAEEAEGDRKEASRSSSRSRSTASSVATSPSSLPNESALGPLSLFGGVDGERGNASSLSFGSTSSISSSSSSYSTVFASPHASSLPVSGEEKIWIRLCPLFSTTTPQTLLNVFYPHGADDVRVAKCHHVMNGFVLFRTEEMARMAVEKVSLLVKPELMAAGFRITPVSSNEVQAMLTTQKKHSPAKLLHEALRCTAPEEEGKAAKYLQQLPYLEGARYMCEEVVHGNPAMIHRIHETLRLLDGGWESAYDFGTELHERLYLRLIDSNCVVQSRSMATVMADLYLNHLLPPDANPFRFATHFLQRIGLRIPHVEGICLFAHLCSTVDVKVSKASFWAVVREIACNSGDSAIAKVLLQHLQQYLRHGVPQDVALPSPSRHSQHPPPSMTASLPTEEASSTRLSSPRPSRVGSPFAPRNAQDARERASPPMPTTISSVVASPDKQSPYRNENTSRSTVSSSPSYPPHSSLSSFLSPLAPSSSSSSSGWRTKQDRRTPQSGGDSSARGNHRRHTEVGQANGVSPFATQCIHHSQDSLLLSPAYPTMLPMAREEAASAGGRSSLGGGVSSFSTSGWSNPPSSGLSPSHSPLSLSGSSGTSPHSLSTLGSSAIGVPHDEDEKYRTVYISHLPPSLCQRNFMHLLTQCGPVQKVRICAGKGYATLFSFVQMQTAHGANELIKLSGANYFNFILRVQIAKNPIQDELPEDAQVNPMTGEISRPCLFGDSSASLLNGISAGDFK